MSLTNTVQQFNRLTIPLLVGVVVLGSILSQFSYEPNYFSDRRNIFNVYFIKLGWFWTSLVFGLRFAFSQEYRQVKNTPRSQKIVEYFLCTAVWWLLTTLFSSIDFMTGTCTDSSFGSPRECRHGGGIWDSIDISGHAYLLIFSSLALLEFSRESLPKETCSSPVRYIEYFSLFIRSLWFIMLLTTFLYFHTLFDKLAGSFLAAASWYLVYQIAAPRLMQYM